jgi:hypothetical protein
MNNTNNTPPAEMNLATLLLIGIIVLTVIGGMLGGDSRPSTYTSTGPDRTSRDYRYVEERMKLEGLSNSDARQAADAVIKFHEAQKARQR